MPLAAYPAVDKVRPRYLVGTKRPATITQRFVGTGFTSGFDYPNRMEEAREVRRRRERLPNG